MTDADRRVHAELPNGLQVVRYSRAGKWYEESPGQRKRIGINEAVALALLPGARIHFFLSGGQMFDAKVRRARGF